MSVDKFGRYSITGERPSFLSKNCSLPLTIEGDYNIGNKRLKFVNEPTDDNDAINLQTLRSEVSTSLRLEGEVFNARNYRIANVGDPIDDSDLITKGYLNLETSTVLKLQGDTFNANNHRITNVAAAVDDSDLVSKEYVHWQTSNTLKHNDNGYFDAKNYGITNVKPGVGTFDVATVSQTLKRTNDGDYDMNGKKIRNAGDPVLPSDLTTVQYVTSLIPSLTSDHWGFSNKRLSNVGTPIYDGEAVNLRYLRENCLSIPENGTDYNGKNKNIKNVNLPKESNDVATKEYIDNILKENALITTKHETDITILQDWQIEVERKITNNKDYYKKQLNKFGVVLFNYIQYKLDGEITSPTADEEPEFLNWDKLFKIPDKESPPNILNPTGPDGEYSILRGVPDNRN